MVVKHQHRLTREATESPSLEIYKTQMWSELLQLTLKLDPTLRFALLWVGVGSDDSRGPFQSKLFCDSVIPTDLYFCNSLIQVPLVFGDAIEQLHLVQMKSMKIIQSLGNMAYK